MKKNGICIGHRTIEGHLFLSPNMTTCTQGLLAPGNKRKTHYSWANNPGIQCMSMKYLISIITHKMQDDRQNMIYETFILNGRMKFEIG